MTDKTLQKSLEYNLKTVNSLNFLESFKFNTGSEITDVEKYIAFKMKNKVIAENLRVISDDKLTVKQGHSTMTFDIYDQSTEILQVAMPSNSTVTDLIQMIKEKLRIRKYPSQRILCLESMNNQEVLDYALLVKDYKLSNFHNHESFRIVLYEEIMSINMISLNDFSFKKCLGQGASASVSLVRHKANGKLYALKQIEKNYFVEFKRMQQVLREKKIMTDIVNNFPFAAKLYSSFQSEKHLNFLLEFYPGGEMFFHLHKKRLTQSQAKLYFAQMTLTFQYLHDQKVVYRDLKPENIMIDFNGHARLTDFGLCKINLSKEDLTTSYCGSIQYMAPEVKESIGYNYSVDFYTLGAFLYEMVMGVPPYYNSQSLYFNQSSSSAYKNLVKGLIQNDVNMRISTFKQIKTSKWMADVRWDQIKKGHLKMPFRVSPYETYIHDEFKDISIQQFNIKHLEKYDRLFDFFTYLKNDQENSDLLRCYRKSTIPSNILSSIKRSDSKNSSTQFKTKKKSSKDKSIRESSSKSKKKKTSSKNSSRKEKLTTEANIYLKKTNEGFLSTHRSVSPKTNIVFKKSSMNLKSVKSGADLLKHALTRM